jgi:hypothetical protein
MFEFDRFFSVSGIVSGNDAGGVKATDRTVGGIPGFHKLY